MARRFDSLRPCPCCRGLPVVLVQRHGDNFTVRAECSNCHMATSEVVYARARTYDEARRLVDLGTVLDLRRAREEVAAIWNRRPD